MKHTTATASKLQDFVDSADDALTSLRDGLADVENAAELRGSERRDALDDAWDIVETAWADLQREVTDITSVATEGEAGHD